MSDQAAPPRRSILDRLAQMKEDSPHPPSIADPYVDPISAESFETPTSGFHIGVTGELIADDVAALPLYEDSPDDPLNVNEDTLGSHHILLLPDSVTEEDLETLALTIWNEAGWPASGVLRLLEGVTLEGPWPLSDEWKEELGGPAHTSQAWLLRCHPRRGTAPSPTVMEFDEWARAFPDGMPVGIELKVLDALRRIARRLRGSIRISGSGQVITPDADSAVSVRVYGNRWIPPDKLRELLSPAIPGLRTPHPDPQTPGLPYALLAPVTPASQVLIGVRQEAYAPRALRWEMWAKSHLYVYELVWAAPDSMADLSKAPTRRGRLERRRANDLIQTAAGLIESALPNSAVIDEDGFLLDLDVPLLEEEQQHL